MITSKDFRSFLSKPKFPFFLSSRAERPAWSLCSLFSCSANRTDSYLSNDIENNSSSHTSSNDEDEPTTTAAAAAAAAAAGVVTMRAGPFKSKKAKSVDSLIGMTIVIRPSRSAADMGRNMIALVFLIASMMFALISLRISMGVEQTSQNAWALQQEEARMLEDFKRLFPLAAAKYGGSSSILNSNSGGSNRSQQRFYTPQAAAIAAANEKIRRQYEEMERQALAAAALQRGQNPVQQQANFGASALQQPTPLLRLPAAAAAQQQQQQQKEPQRQQQQQRARRQQDPTGGAFVHIGKTGGSALSILLRNGCHSFEPHPCRNVTAPETPASHAIRSYYHVPDFGLLPVSRHDFYVITVRDPFARTVSAFVFEHYRNRVARQDPTLLGEPWKMAGYQQGYNCFPTLQDYVELLQGNASDYHYPWNKNTLVADSCPDLAKASLAGKLRKFNHLYFNYQRVRSLLPDSVLNPEQPTATLYVARQEHLMEDWISINQALGQQQQQQQRKQKHNSLADAADVNVVVVDPTVVRNMTAIPYPQPVTRNMTAQGRDWLCQALRSEYAAYVWFLQQAVNLSPDDYQASIQDAIRTCPVLKEDFVSWQ